MKSVSLKFLVEKLDLEIIYKSSDFEKIEIELNEINRPGLQLSGFFDNFPYKRIQIIGQPEDEFYNKYLPFNERRDRFDTIFSYKIPALIYTYSISIPYEVFSLAKKHDRTILRSNYGSTRLISKMNAILEYALSEEIRIHGGLLEVFGMGILITGKSSIGKSETALELIARGHRLVADDAVDIMKIDDRTILRSNYGSTRLISKMNAILEYALSEEIRIHGGLLEVFGMGILITGKSSIGKSETALELIARGHRLVADDAVDIMKIDDKLYGQSPKNIRHFLEIRGIGILDIQRLYGVGAIKRSAEIDFIIELEKWDDDKEYDRLGLDESYKTILGVELPYIVIPVKPGRNIALIVEVAARNIRQKMYGYNAAKELNKRILDEIKNKSKLGENE